MQKIPLSKAQPGMVLAKPVARDTGVVLMGEGTELNDALIEKLHDLDIQKIVVKGRPLETGGDEKSVEQLCEEIEERFSTVSSDRLCSQIKDLIIQDMKRRREEDDL
jgi:hypothetical protein